MAGFIERIVAVADTADYGMKSKIAAAQAPSANFSRPIAAIVARSEIMIGMDVGTVNTRLHAAAVPLEQRIEVKTALVRAGWLPRAEAPGTVHAGQGDMRMPRKVVQTAATRAAHPATSLARLCHSRTWTPRSQLRTSPCRSGWP